MSRGKKKKGKRKTTQWHIIDQRKDQNGIHGSINTHAQCCHHHQLSPNE